MLKRIIVTMVSFFIIIVLCGGGISIFITRIIGGGDTESYIYPIYIGIILLAGLIVGCTCLILQKLEVIAETNYNSFLPNTTIPSRFSVDGKVEFDKEYQDDVEKAV